MGLIGLGRPNERGSSLCVHRKRSEFILDVCVSLSQTPVNVSFSVLCCKKKWLRKKERIKYEGDQEKKERKWLSASIYICP